MGGRGKRAPQLTPADFVWLCIRDNQEAEGAAQEISLLSGWKLRKWTRIPTHDLPYFDAVTGLWWLPDTDGYRMQVTRVEAMSRLTAGGNMTRKRIA